MDGSNDGRAGRTSRTRSWGGGIVVVALVGLVLAVTGGSSAGALDPSDCVGTSNPGNTGDNELIANDDGDRFGLDYSTTWNVPLIVDTPSVLANDTYGTVWELPADRLRAIRRRPAGGGPAGPSIGAESTARSSSAAAGAAWRSTCARAMPTPSSTSMQRATVAASTDLPTPLRPVTVTSLTSGRRTSCVTWSTASSRPMRDDPRRRIVAPSGPRSSCTATSVPARNGTSGR